MKWKTKLVSASSPISIDFSETTALDVSEIHWPGSVKQAAGHIKPAVVWSDHCVLVLSLDVVRL